MELFLTLVGGAFILGIVMVMVRLSIKALGTPADRAAMLAIAAGPGQPARPVTGYRVSTPSGIFHWPDHADPGVLAKLCPRGHRGCHYRPAATQPLAGPWPDG